jgi:hypothetical protein
MSFHKYVARFLKSIAPRPGSSMGFLQKNPIDDFEFMRQREILRQSKINHSIYCLAAVSSISIAWIGVYLSVMGDPGGVVASTGGCVSAPFCLRLADEARETLKLLDSNNPSVKRKDE